MHHVGTAGWSIPPQTPRTGSRLQHYSRTLTCTEVNSTFYRPHRPSTWARWAKETPPEFRFSLKAPKTITHGSRLQDARALLAEFLEQLQPLGDKAGPLLFQLPPSLAFDPSLAEDFLSSLRSQYSGEAVLEPRHASWFTPASDQLLHQHQVARVAADPPSACPEAAHPGGSPSLLYYRLHGSPRMYYSAYSDEFLVRLAAAIRSHANVWVIFDNTASGCAFPNAQRLQQVLLVDSPLSEQV